jgi:hypothetical protein
MLHHRIFTRDAADAGIFTRDVTLSPSSWNAEARTFSVVVSSGADVVRQDARGAYIERPDINQNWRQLVGAPVLNSHQRNDIKNILGSVTDVTVVGKEVHATIRMSKSAEGEAAVQAALEGHLRGISFGYRIDATKESVEGGKRIVTITKLTPVEISLVPIPADPAAVIRSASGNMDVVLSDRALLNQEIRTIARTAGLPQSWVDQQIDAPSPSVEAARASAFATLQLRSAAAESIRVASTGFSSDDPEWRRNTIGEALHSRMTGVTPSEAARPFAGLSMVELARDCLRVRNLSTTGSPAVIVERALSTSDLPYLMGDALDRTMRGAYQLAPSALKRVSRQVTARDFRKRHRLQMSSAPTLEQINELGEFRHGSVADSEETYGLATFGRIISLSRQLIVNDDLAALSDLTRRMGLAAAGFEADRMANLLENAPNMADGDAVFHANHHNLAGSGGAISDTTLTAGRLAMRKQTEPGGQLIDVVPKLLLVPSELETLAEKTVTSIQATQTANVNPFAFLSVIVEPRLSDAKAWYLACDPASIDGMEHCYLDGQIGPQVFSEVGFETDGVKYKIRLDFACAFVEPRGFYKNPGQ